MGRKIFINFSDYTQRRIGKSNDIKALVADATESVAIRALREKIRESNKRAIVREESTGELASSLRVSVTGRVPEVYANGEKNEQKLTYLLEGRPGKFVARQRSQRAYRFDDRPRYKGRKKHNRNGTTMDPVRTRTLLFMPERPRISKAALRRKIASDMILAMKSRGVTVRVVRVYID